MAWPWTLFSLVILILEMDLMCGLFSFVWLPGCQAKVLKERAADGCGLEVVCEETVEMQSPQIQMKRWDGLGDELTNILCDADNDGDCKEDGDVAESCKAVVGDEMAAARDSTLDKTGDQVLQFYVKSGEQMQQCSLEQLMGMLHIQIKETLPEMEPPSLKQLPLIEQIAKEHSYVLADGTNRGRSKKLKSMSKHTQTPRSFEKVEDKLSEEECSSCKSESCQTPVNLPALGHNKQDRSEMWNHAKKLLSVVQPPTGSVQNGQTGADTIPSDQQSVHSVGKPVSPNVPESVTVSGLSDSNGVSVVSGCSQDLDLLHEGRSDSSDWTFLALEGGLDVDSYLMPDCENAPDLDDQCEILLGDDNHCFENVLLDDVMDMMKIQQHLSGVVDSPNSQASSSSSIQKFLPPSKASCDQGEGNTTFPGHSYKSSAMETQPCCGIVDEMKGCQPPATASKVQGLDMQQSSAKETENEQSDNRQEYVNQDSACRMLQCAANNSQAPVRNQSVADPPTLSNRMAGSGGQPPDEPREEQQKTSAEEVGISGFDGLLPWSSMVSCAWNKFSNDWLLWQLFLVCQHCC